MDPFYLMFDALSVAVLSILLALSARATHNFNQSKRALVESASLISVIVDALTSRIGESESAVDLVRTEIEGLRARNSGIEWEQASLRASHLQLLGSLQQLLTNDKRLIAELELLKRKSTSSLTGSAQVQPPPKRLQLGGVVGQTEILVALTPTERQTLDILLREGSKAAPDLGKRLNKSREHTARLMKKLYLEGYVDRESNRAPFRYKLTEPVRSALQATPLSVKEEAQEKA